MLMLWMFGSDLERDWGRTKFYNYYFVCGVGAGLLDVAARFAFGGSTAGATIGASGAIYGVLLAFGLLYPNRTIYVFLMFPIPARIFVLIMGVIAFLSAVAGSGRRGGALCPPGRNGLRILLLAAPPERAEHRLDGELPAVATAAGAAAI